MDEWEDAGSRSGAPTVELPRTWVVIGAVAVLAGGAAMGAALFGDVGETPCYEVREESVRLEVSLHEGEDVSRSAADLAALTRRHPGCFEPRWAENVNRLAQEGPPTIGVLQRPRGPEDELTTSEVGGDLVASEARLVSSTDVGDVYVVPRRSRHDRAALDEVCLLLVSGEPSTSTSCAVPGVSSLHLSNVGFPVVVTMTIHHGRPSRGLVGLVGDGVSEVLVDGVPTAVDGNVFIAPDAPEGASVRVPDGTG